MSERFEPKAYNENEEAHISKWANEKFEYNGRMIESIFDVCDYIDAARQILGEYISGAPPMILVVQVAALLQASMNSEPIEDAIRGDG